MKPYFFESNPQLFGALHSVRGNGGNSQQTVVICPPIGQEYIRTHWCLRLLARQLSRKGIQTLRTDYRGIGDSAGSSEQTTSLQQWHQDVHAAIEFACKQTNSQNVILAGLRYGGTIAAKVAAESDRVAAVVLWEPVLDTKKYLQDLRHMHRRMLDLWVCKLKTPNDPKHEEILGSRYRRSLIDEMESESLDLEALDQPQFIVDRFEQRDLYTLNAMQRFMPTEDEDSWTNLETLETGWLRAGTSRQVVLMADEMFARLKGFGQLGSYTPSKPSALPTRLPNAGLPNAGLPNAGLPGSTSTFTPSNTSV